MTENYPQIAEFKIISDDSYLYSIVKYWGFFKKDEILNKDSQLLMLDIDFGRKCSLRCPSCFRKNNLVDGKKYSDISYSKLTNVIEEAKKIGLQQIKICGAGEPLENPLLLDFVKHMSTLNIYYSEKWLFK